MQELESYIQNNISKIENIPINGYFSTVGNITIQLKNIISCVGNQKVQKRRFKEEKELKRRQRRN